MTTPTTSKAGGSAGSKTGGAKLAQNQQDEIDAVVATDPTEAGDRKGLTDTAGVGDAVVVKVEDGVAPSVYDVTDTQEFVTLSRDLVEEFFYPDTKRPSYRLLYTKGQVVPRSAVEQYNADVEAANKRRENGGIDPENPAGIDSTTIASGTKVGLVEGSDLAQK